MGELYPSPGSGPDQALKPLSAFEATDHVGCAGVNSGEKDYLSVDYFSNKPLSTPYEYSLPLHPYEYPEDRVGCAGVNSGEKDYFS